MSIVVLTYWESTPGDLALYFSISPESIFFAAYLATAEAIVAVGDVCCGMRCEVEQ